MQDQSLGPFTEFIRRLSEYLPTLAAGVLVFALGVAVGWVVKRAVVRILIWLRLDRLGGRVGWRTALSKGDVRAALYNIVGGAAMLLVILIFLDNALEILGLSVLSRMIDGLVLYVPNLGLVALIIGVGMLIAHATATRVTDALEEEEIVRARLIGKLTKAIILAVVGAIGLWQLNLARQIVLSAFLVAFGAVGVAFSLAVGLGSFRAIQRGWELLFEKAKKD